MRVVIYGKEGCALCQAAKVKLHRLGVAYECEAMEDVLSGRVRCVGALVQWSMSDGALPVIVIDGEGMSYPAAMRKLKELRT